MISNLVGTCVYIRQLCESFTHISVEHISSHIEVDLLSREGETSKYSIQIVCNL